MTELRNLTVLLMMLLLLLTGAGCGDDSGSDSTGDDGSAGSAGGEAGGGAGTSGENTDAGNNADSTQSLSDVGAVDGGTTDAPAEVVCADGEQDNDADGECSAACSDAVDCGAGVCSDATGAISCLCDVGYIGDACDTCATGHEGSGCGTCSSGFIAYQRTEGACIEDPCASVECGNTGSCAVEDDAAVCVCDLGFAGDACNICADGYEGTACDTCAADYSKVDAGCVPDVCVGKDCGNGSCLFQAPDTAVCECDAGYQGDACDSCELGYLMKDGACVLELPVQNDSLTFWIDMLSPTQQKLTTEANEVLLLRSETPGGGQKDALYDLVDATRAPTFASGASLSFLKFDGDDFLKVEDIDLGARGYTIFIAMAPDTAGGNMAALAAVGTSNDAHHGMLLRSQAGGTQVRYVHRNPLGISGGDNLLLEDIAAREAFDPYQVAVAERRLDGDAIIQRLFVGDQEQFSSTSDGGFGSTTLDLLIGQQDGAGNNPFVGNIGEIIIFDGEISVDERAQVKAYLEKKWVPKLKIGGFKL